MRLKLVSLVLIAMLAMMIIPTQPAKAHFVLSGSGYPDQYGQGIEVLYTHENSTGSWLGITDPAFLIFPANNSDSNIDVEYTSNTAIKLIIGVNINHSLHGLSTHSQAVSMIMVNVTLTHGGVDVFSQGNVSWNGGTVFNDTVTTWTLNYEIVLNVIIASGEIYSLNITYELFYAEELLIT